MSKSITPGPWRVDNGDVVGANNAMLGSEADLNLIAAAPDLYEALKGAVEFIEQVGRDYAEDHGVSYDDCEEGDKLKVARAALLKALPPQQEREGSGSPQAQAETVSSREDKRP